MDAVLTIAGIVVGVLVAGFLVLTGVGVTLLALRARRGDRAVASGTAAPGGELLRADEALRDADDELAFASAQFGEEATAEFRAAVDVAHRELRRAFELQQRISDHPAADPRRRRDWSRDVAAISRRVAASLEQEGRRFAERRGEEAAAGDAVAALRSELERLRSARDAAAEALSGLGAIYASGLLSPVAGNPEEAERLLGRASERLDAAEAELAAKRVTAVGGALGEARDELSRAGALLQAVGRRRDELAAADEALAALQGQAGQALEEARTVRDAPPDPDSGDAVGSAMAQLGAVLDRLRPDPGDGPRDPVAGLDALVAASEALDTAVAAARNQQRRLDGARGALEGALVSARTQIAAVRDYIGARRGSVGVDARTRLAEAERQLELAEREADPVEALDAARRAQTHARDADALARYRE